MKTIKFIIGLPCSGKSTLLQSFKGVDYAIVDDPTNFDDDVLPVLLANEKIAIADSTLCIEKNRTLAHRKVLEAVGEATFHWIYFENFPEKCLVNMDTRMHGGDLRDVEKDIMVLSKIYNIPELVTPLRIFN